MTHDQSKNLKWEEILRYIELLEPTATCLTTTGNYLPFRVRTCCTVTSIAMCGGAIKYELRARGDTREEACRSWWKQAVTDRRFGWRLEVEKNETKRSYRFNLDTETWDMLSPSEVEISNEIADGCAEAIAEYEQAKREEAQARREDTYEHSTLIGRRPADDDDSYGKALVEEIYRKTGQRVRTAKQMLAHWNEEDDPDFQKLINTPPATPSMVVLGATATILKGTLMFVVAILASVVFWRAERHISDRFK